MWRPCGRSVPSLCSQTPNSPRSLEEGAAVALLSQTCGGLCGARAGRPSRSLSRVWWGARLDMLMHGPCVYTVCANTAHMLDSARTHPTADRGSQGSLA